MKMIGNVSDWLSYAGGVIKVADSAGSTVEEELYYRSSENKGADQLWGYREANLRLYFRLCRLLVFPCGGSFVVTVGLTISNKLNKISF